MQRTANAQSAFDARISEAAAPFIAKLRKRHPHGQGVPNPRIHTINTRIVEKLRTIDANSYCPGLIQKLQAIDADTFMSRVKAAYVKYRKASKQGDASPESR
jgi:hypothetical protein